MSSPLPRGEGKGEGKIGLIAGSGRLPFLFASAARERGQEVVAVGHRGETDPALEHEVGSFTWVRLGQVSRIARTLRAAGVRRAVMAGGIGRVRAFTEIRPDLGALEIVAGLRSFRDDALLRAVASYFEARGIEIVAPTDYVRRALAPEGLLAGPAPSEGAKRDIALGLEVARALGRADVGQTVVVRGGHVLAVEAVEGTDEAIRRGGRLGGAGATVVKRCKPGQDLRFDLPAIGPETLAVMAAVGARVLALEAGRTIILQADSVLRLAGREAISVVGVQVQDG